MRGVMVEVCLIRALGEARLGYRRCAGPLRGHEDPDAAARRLGGASGAAALVHSTSWRCEDDGRLVLTYAVVPDPDPSRPATPLADTVELARGERADRPAPSPSWSRRGPGLRREGRYAAADRIRDALASCGVELRDSPGGTDWFVPGPRRPAPAVSETSEAVEAAP